MIDNKLFAGGGLNFDDDYHLMSKNDWIDAKNVRINSTAAGYKGAVVNIKGTTQRYEVTFPNGTYVSVGARGFDNVGKIFMFLALSEGTDPDSKIVVWDVNTGTGTILVDKDNFATGTDVLNFNLERRINHIDLVDEKYLYWVESAGDNPVISPRMLDITKNYGSMTEKSLSVIKQPPLLPISNVRSIDDPAGFYNSLDDKAWQFKYRYVYWDNSKSAYSPASSIGNQRSRGNAAIKTFASKVFDSAIRFNFDGGGDLVKGVEIIGRISETNDWKLISSFDFENQSYLPVYRLGISDVPSVSYVINFVVNGNTTQLIGTASSSKLALDDLNAKFDASLLPNSIRKSYVSNINGFGYMEFTPIDSSISFSMSTATQSQVNLIQAQSLISNTNSNNTYTFTSSLNLSPVDQTEANAPFDYVPLFANSQANPNGNYLTYGDYTEGYDNVDVDFAIDYTTRNINKSLYSVTMENGVYSTTEGYVRFNFSGTFSTDSVLIYQKAFVDNNYAYFNAVPIFENETEDDFLQRFGQILRNTEADNADKIIVVDTGLRRVEYKYPTTGGDDTLFFESVLLSRNTDMWFKGGSKLKASLMYIDDYGRFGAANTNNGNEINIPIIQSLNFAMQSNQPRMIINSIAPSWASKYAILLTKSLSVGKQLQMPIDDPITFNNDGTITLVKNHIDEYNTNFNANIDISFVSGDEVVLMNNDGDVFTTTLKEINDDGNFVIYGNGLTSQTITNFNIRKFEIRQRVEGNDSIYYEVALIGDVDENGYHLVPVGTSGNDQGLGVPARVNIVNGNTPVRNIWIDSYPSAVRESEWLEFYSFSDYDPSLVVNNIGTPNQVNPFEKQTRYPAAMRYGGAYVIGTEINNINSFDVNSYKEASLVFGPIQKLDIDGSMMIIGQRLRLARAGIFESMFLDKEGNETVAISEKLLSEVGYYDYEVGIGDCPEAYCRWGSTKWGVDKNRGIVWRLAKNGVTPISITAKANSYFVPKLKGAISVVSGFDPTNQELYITILDGVSNETIVFSEEDNRFSMFWEGVPTSYVTLYQNLYAFSGNFLWELNNSSTYNNFFGVQKNSSITFLGNDNPAIKKSFLALSEIASELWTVPEITTDLSQESSLVAGNFKQLEGEWHAAFLRDSRTRPGLANPLFNGPALKGKWIKCKLQNTSTNFVYLLSAGIKYIISPQTGV